MHLAAQAGNQLVVEILLAHEANKHAKDLHGGLLGVRDGEEAVLDEWKDSLQFSSEFRSLVEEVLSAQRVIPTDRNTK